jgi:hypothetical protein
MLKMSENTENIIKKPAGRPKGVKNKVPRKPNVKEKTLLSPRKLERDGYTDTPEGHEKARKTAEIVNSENANNVKEIYKKMVEMAKAGDFNACKYLLDRTIPMRKGARINLHLPEVINTVEELDEATNQVINMMSDAQISPEEALLICNVIEYRSKVIELRDGVGQIEGMRRDLAEIKKFENTHKFN